MVNLKAEAAAVLAEEEKGLKAIKAKDVSGVVATYMRDALVLPPNAPALQGVAAMRRFWAEMFAAPGFDLDESDWKVEVARSGDLAYLTGRFKLTTKGARGRKVTSRGKFVDVWKKRPRSGWKHALSMFNTDEPVPGAK